MDLSDSKQPPGCFPPSTSHPQGLDVWGVGGGAPRPLLGEAAGPTALLRDPRTGAFLSGPQRVTRAMTAVTVTTQRRTLLRVHSKCLTGVLSTDSHSNLGVEFYTTPSGQRRHPERQPGPGDGVSVAPSGGGTAGLGNASMTRRHPAETQPRVLRPQAFQEPR